MESNTTTIPGHGDCYVRRDGTVWKDGKQKTPIRKGNQALKVRLQTDRLVVEYGLATLVARAFVPNPNDYAKVIFRDGNKYNCAAGNLRWVSHEEFSRHSWHKGSGLPQRHEDTEKIKGKKKEGGVGEREATEKKEPIAYTDGRKMIPGTMGYWVTEAGEIYNPKGMLLKMVTAPNKGAWVKVKDKMGERVKTTVAKLVALTFIPNPEGHERVIFRDRNKMNACVENLMWVSDWQYRSWYRPKNLAGDGKRKQEDVVERSLYSVAIRDFAGYYLAPDGTVYKGNRTMAPVCEKQRAVRVSLYDKETGMRFRMGLGTLVATHFVPNPRRHKYIVFKDRNNRNCHMDNIAWVDGQTFAWYSGLLLNPGRKKTVLTQAEALQRCTHTLLLHYYKTLDESWLADVWQEIDAELAKRRQWRDYKSDCYLYFVDRVKRFSILGNPVWLMKWYLKILAWENWKGMSAAMPRRVMMGTDESLRNVGEYE